MDRLVQLLILQGKTICSCESLTGGLFVNKLTEIPGVSKTLKGGVVTYWNEIKVDVVHVKQETVDTYGVVSKECAYEMASNVKEIFDTDVAVSFTGNAGPDSLEGKPKGIVFTCICIGDKSYGYEDHIDLPRNELRNEIVKRTADRIYELLMNRKNKEVIYG